MTVDAQELDWQNASAADRAKAHKILSYLSCSVMDYDYLVRIVAAALAAEREVALQKQPEVGQPEDRPT
jgi:hypothetical protein